MVRVSDHPRAKRSLYVFEHILVAERLLGRYLEPGESVHHRNGLRIFDSRMIASARSSRVFALRH